MKRKGGSTGEGRKLALITGASSGIGLEIASILATRGCDLIITGRDRLRLERLAARCGKSGSVSITVADLSTPAGVEALLAFVEAKHRPVDILVNNAGFGDLALFKDADPARQLEMIQVNIAALVSLTRAILPSMMSAGRGSILNVSSTAAFAPGPRMSVYYATKAFVLSFSEAIATEVSGSGVTVSTLCPGATATDFDRAVGARGGRRARRGAMGARKVAEAAVRGMERGKRIIIPGTRNRLSAFFSRFAPRAAAAQITYRLNRSK